MNFKHLTFVFIFVFVVSCDSSLEKDDQGPEKSSQKNAAFSEVIRTLDEKDFDEALNLSNNLPESGYKYNFIGICHRALGNFQLAIDNFNTALNFPDKNTINVLINLGHAFSDLGDATSSADNYNLALSTINQDLPTTHPDDEHLLIHKKGLIHLYKNELDDALSYFEEAKTKRLTNLESDHALFANSYNYLAYTHYLKGDQESAVNFLDLAFEVDHQDIKISIESKMFAKIINSNDSKNGQNPTGGVKEDLYP